MGLVFRFRKPAEELYMEKMAQWWLQVIKAAPHFAVGDMGKAGWVLQMRILFEIGSVSKTALALAIAANKKFLIDRYVDHVVDADRLGLKTSIEMR